jgi:hypothetical protein
LICPNVATQFWPRQRSWARHINNKGRVALLVEGDDGMHLTKQQIAAEPKNSEREDDRDSAA